MEKVLDNIEIFETLKFASSVSRRLDLDYRDIKPCITYLIYTGLERGGYPNRKTGALIIASELKRLNKTREEILMILRNWNRINRPPLNYSEIEDVVRSAFRKDYRYSCKNENLKIHCVGNDTCPYYKLLNSDKKYTNNRKFLEYGWQLILSNVAIQLYYIGIPELERRLGVGAGGKVIANHQTYARWSGITPKSVKKALLELKGTPLIKRFVIGTSRKWEGKATLIQRTIPIPLPPKELLLKTEKLL